MSVTVHSRHRPHGGPARGPEDRSRQLLELLVNVAHCENLREAGELIVACLPEGAERAQIAVAVFGRDRMCRLTALSRRSKLDRRSERVRAIESALDEAVLNGEPIVFPPPAGDVPPAKTHAYLARLIGCEWIVTAPLTDAEGRGVGGWMIFGPASESAAAAARWLHEAGTGVAAAVRTVRRAEQGAFARASETIRRHLGTRGKRRLAVAALVAILLFVVVPVPYRVACECTLEPVKRRFVAAPFDGTLAGVLAAPGDTVAAGQTLARLDGREIRWELASLRAAYEQAHKARDAALAERDTAAGQLARLEMEQIDHKMALLESRQKNLDIKSPLDGVVISGDLERVAGAPVAVGQTLFEIAPLDEVIVEVAVDESEIANVNEHAASSIELDAFPGRHFSGVVARMHPRAELRDTDQVFIAEVLLENRDGALRPGMRGQAKVAGPWASPAWILLHKPIQATRHWLGW